MIQKILVEDIQRISTKKNPTNGEIIPLTYYNRKTRAQSPFERIRIKTTIDGRSQFIQCPDYEGIYKGLRTGEQIEVSLQLKEFNGTQYFEFFPPRKLDLLEERIKKLEEHVFLRHSSQDEAPMPDNLPF